MHLDIPVKEIMTRDVCKANVSENIHSVAKKMVEYGVGSAVIMDGSKAVGIITEKDLIAKVVAKNKSPSSVRVKEVMSSPLITIKPTTSIREAASIMTKKGIRRLPVINDSGELVGIITDNDILSISLDLGELASLVTEPSSGFTEEMSGGICEKCGKYVDVLYHIEGLNICEDCSEREG